MHPELNRLDSQPLRLPLRFSEFELDIVHRVGVNHLATDAFSQLKTTRTHQTQIVDEILVLSITTSIPQKRGKCSVYAEIRRTRLQRRYWDSCSKGYYDTDEYRT